LVEITVVLVEDSIRFQLSNVNENAACVGNPYTRSQRSAFFAQSSSSRMPRMLEQPERAGCLFAILKLFGVAPPTALPYRRKDYLLSQAERSLFSVLNEAVKDHHIFAKVRLADLVWMPKGTASWQSHFNRVQSKHIDFVICDRKSIRPLLCIELDDASHSRSDRQTRDQFMDAALLAAGLPLIRIRAARGYNVAELRQGIEATIAMGK
jgi:hypothetical protein